MEENGRNCRESLEAFKAFYDQVGPTMTAVHQVMFKLIPHSSDIKAPAEACNGQNYREYQRSFAILAHHFHAVFDYWKQQVLINPKALVFTDTIREHLLDSEILVSCRNTNESLELIRHTEGPMMTTTP